MAKKNTIELIKKNKRVSAEIVEEFAMSFKESLTYLAKENPIMFCKIYIELLKFQDHNESVDTEVKEGEVFKLKFV